jgi:hypothetical protein
MKKKTNTSQAKEIMRKPMLVPQPKPFIIDAAVKRVVRRKVTDAEKGLIEARSFTAGRKSP